MNDNNICEQITQNLIKYDVTVVFGIVGIPIVELANHFINSKKIKFIPFRNEQAASYAASCYSYLMSNSSKSKICGLLVVGGPGIIHALSGVFNSIENKWPLLVMAGSLEASSLYKAGGSGFQELDQVNLLSNFHINFTGRLDTNIPNCPDRVFHKAINGCIQSNNVSYIDIPGNLISNNNGTNNNTSINTTSSSKYNITSLKIRPDPNAIKLIASTIIRKSKMNLLLVVGKGAVNSSAAIRKFVNKYQIPFLPTPMAKGIIEDSNPLNVSSARSASLQKAELVIVLGARLNWILHFGESPKWNDNVQFIQADRDPKSLEFSNDTNKYVGCLSDIDLFVNDLMASLDLEIATNNTLKLNNLIQLVKKQIEWNVEKLKLKESKPGYQNLLTYNQVYSNIRSHLIDSETIIVAEGANTMDIARISFPTDYPKRRLDAATTATMGCGLPYAITAKLTNPDKLILCIQGDSAFGFSGMELETAHRCNLPIIVIVMNNSGIYHGYIKNKNETGNLCPSTALSKNCRYDLVARGLGFKGYLVHDLRELNEAFIKAVKDYKENGVGSLLNVIIEPGKQGKLEFGWQGKNGTNTAARAKL